MARYGKIYLGPAYQNVVQTNGDGTLAVAGATSGDTILFRAQESFNNDTGSAALVRVRRAYGTMPTA